MFGRAKPGLGDGAEFFHQGLGTKSAALCLHGFSGSPFEVRPIAQEFARRGHTVLAPVIAGHGVDVAHLAQTAWPDWLLSARKALIRLQLAAPGAAIAVVGFSMGGLLALRLAMESPNELGALAVLAAPLRLSRFKSIAVRTLAVLPRPLRPLTIPKFGFDTRDPDMARQNPGLPGLPLGGIISLLDLGAQIRSRLHEVRTPTFIAYGRRDRTVPRRDFDDLKAGLGTQVRQICFLRSSGHLLAIDVERQQLVESVCTFVDDTLGPS